MKAAPEGVFMAVSQLSGYLVSIREIICPDGYSFNSDKVNEALERLFSHTDALIAWEKLYNLDVVFNESDIRSDEDLKATKYLKSLTKNEQWLLFIGLDFSHAFKRCFITDNQRLTKNEIKESVKLIHKKAQELAHLINDNFVLLDISLSDCLSSIEQEAFYKMKGYLQSEYDHVKQFNSTFSAQDYLVMAHHNGLLAQDLRDILWRFSEVAISKIDTPPIKAKPKSDDLGARIFCELFCQMCVSVYGKPNTDIACSFVSAIFDKTYSLDTVKSWWDRYGENSGA